MNLTLKSEGRLSRFWLTNTAVDDLRSIGRYTYNQWGKDQRNFYLKRLDNGFRTIAREPKIGVTCNEICKGYRKYHVGRHLIFYFEVATHVEIVRILHERMDVDSHFQ